ncbi:sensor histidine kinase [Candidatus Clostridium stratigraminis]|uniref:histidine kinase n=1 Tax=Candidatus Clostridium stratigraminis TaxID=3381661 RepID=A0ABW8SZ70_9CLOT
MKKTDVFNFINSYFIIHLKEIILLAVFCFIFALVFSLYNLPLEPVIYAIVLCANLLIIFLIVDFSKLYKRHKLLQNLKSSAALNFDSLPEPKDITERDYYDLFAAVYKEKLQISYNAEVSRSNLIDYYTLWVHQIKTPISAMHLILQSEESELSSELSMELFKIEQYVEFVLQYLRLESMSSDLVLKKYSLDDIVKQAVRKYARMFIRKKIKLNFKELDCMVLTDEKWLEFVIEQLLSNALKYTKEGTISIYMDSLSEKTLVIEDTGIGIREEDLTRIFERGFTGFNGRWDKKSTGLGLYMCKQILGKLSHSIIIESKLDVGTRIMINLETIKVDVE